MLDRDTTAKVVAERLRDEIQDGTLSPGTRLRQNEVARRFGVSTTPVREAFAQLQAEGLVRIDPHRGAVVFRPTTDDLVEFYEIREVLESLAVVRAIPRLAALIENLRDASTPYIHMFVAGRPPSERANEEHQAILDACVQGDAAAAELAVREHLSSAANDLVRDLSGAETGAGDGQASSAG
jgi:DNA-binding GntR family transcriptional regulator